MRSIQHVTNVCVEAITVEPLAMRNCEQDSASHVPTFSLSLHERSSNTVGRLLRRQPRGNALTDVRSMDGDKETSGGGQQGRGEWVVGQGEGREQPRRLTKCVHCPVTSFKWPQAGGPKPHHSPLPHMQLWEGSDTQDVVPAGLRAG